MPEFATSNNNFTQAQLENPYEAYETETEYIWDSGLCQLPIAVDPGFITPASGLESRPACAIVRMCAPFGQKIVRWSAARQGYMPQVPSPSYDNPNEVPTSVRVRVHTPPLDDAGAQRLFKAEGVYVYLLIEPRFPLDGFPIGTTPYDVTAKDVYVLGPENYDPSLTP